MNKKEIHERLFELADAGYRDFHRGLVPGINGEKFIGVRVPDMRKLAKEMVQRGNTEEEERAELEDFLQQTSYEFYEENQLRSFVLDLLNEDFSKCLERTRAFLPMVDNWAVCDSFKPRGLKKEPKALYKVLDELMACKEPFTVRWAVVIQISWFLGEWFEPEMAENIAKVAWEWSADAEVVPAKESDQYYVLMAIAWYWSMALLKQPQCARRYFFNGRLPVWVHNKALQKAVESRQFSEKEKEEFRSLKIK